MKVNKIFFVLFAVGFFFLPHEDNEGLIKRIAIGDVNLVFDKQLVGDVWYREESDFLYIELSLPDLKPYNKKEHGKNKVRVFFDKTHPNSPTLDDRMVNIGNAFGAVLNDNGPYEDLYYYSTKQKYDFDFFTSKYIDLPLFIDCDKVKDSYYPQCEFNYIYLSNQVVVGYFYPRLFLSDWKFIHLRIKSIVEKLISKEN
ncbi:hypothetical protein [Vibrio lentus]|uniref:Uncharacterized protein n=1 Tax=Vibrio lentus TaxID=136468 RepID=A0A2N7C763_9VIBR|nr:hypothetical protein [Vibrio lentus]PME54451.1 hypothetical protein BCV34_21515 [Vibrio lentus]PME74990.1 hypothetical protein BCV30_20810 [Vibrio lentus]PME89948.1 hypothetical protein BCV27_22540 [Vibrio lentus]PMH93240.1 hypothetical protein BCU56_23015 [Vibrio lentus]PMI11435.1 hypothetical protein BCU53_22435 [Vibrio lentus]